METFGKSSIDSSVLPLLCLSFVFASTRTHPMFPYSLSMQVCQVCFAYSFALALALTPRRASEDTPPPRNIARVLTL